MERCTTLTDSVVGKTPDSQIPVVQASVDKFELLRSRTDSLGVKSGVATCGEEGGRVCGAAGVLLVFSFLAVGVTRGQTHR